MAGRCLAPVLVVLFIVSTATGVLAAPDIEAPTYRAGERWVYDVQGELPALFGLENGTAGLSIQGNATLTAEGVDGNAVALRWEGNLHLEGSVELDGGSPIAAEIEGTLQVDRRERHEASLLLPVEVRSTSTFEVSITSGFFSIGYAAELEEVVRLGPGEGLPAFPVGEGEELVSVPTQRWTNLTLSFAGADNTTSVFEAVESVLHINVTGGHDVQVPAGGFVATQVEVEALQGASPGLLQPLLPGATEAAYYGDVGDAPLLLEYRLGETLVGSVRLRSHAAGSVFPPWALALLVGGVLAVPVGILAYRYWRERRRGL